MVLNITERTCLIFDLDDTLYKEIDYLKSAYYYIANTLSADPNSLYAEMIHLYDLEQNVFEYLIGRYDQGVSLEYLLNLYRTHKPEIALLPGLGGLFDFIRENKVKCGVISDGRSITQRNKLAALQIFDILDFIVISEEIGSEKPDSTNYRIISDTYKQGDFYYFGDNLNKDFVSPNKLGWTTICLKDDGQNIHTQNWNHLVEDYKPQFTINSWLELDYA